LDGDAKKGFWEQILKFVAVVAINLMNAYINGGKNGGGNGGFNEK
jgi:hypothetical protein